MPLQTSFSVAAAAAAVRQPLKEHNLVSCSDEQTPFESVCHMAPHVARLIAVLLLAAFFEASSSTQILHVLCR
jgi:hypothetical protein